MKDGLGSLKGKFEVALGKGRNLLALESNGARLVPAHDSLIFPRTEPGTRVLLSRQLRHNSITKPQTTIRNPNFQTHPPSTIPIANFFIFRTQHRICSAKSKAVGNIVRGPSPPSPPPSNHHKPPQTMSQTMLLNKRLTSFFSQNTTPQLPTLLLISPTGKLLSSSSPLPASQLRMQATLACTLWNLYQPLQANNGDILSAALSSQSSSSLRQSRSNPFPTISTPGGDDQSCITIQLSEGIMVIRALKCKLLFVAIGVSSVPTVYPTSPMLHAQAQHLSSSSFGSPPTSPSPQHTEGQDSPLVGSHGDKEGHRESIGSSLAVKGSKAPSEAGSVGSTTRREQANIMAVKRQADEVGRWLEGSLEGFSLSSGEGR